MNRHLARRQTAFSLNKWHMDQARKAAASPPCASASLRLCVETRIQVCAIPDCQIEIRPGLLMCAHHWCHVPTELQREVHVTWAALRDAPLSTLNPQLTTIADAYRDARARAISSVEAP